MGNKIIATENKANLSEENALLVAEINELKSKLEKQQETIKHLLDLLYGKKSEKNIVNDNTSQMSMTELGIEFNEAEGYASTDEIEVKTFKRIKSSKKYQDIDLSLLTKTTTIIELPTTNCEHCNNKLINIEDKVLKHVKYTPGTFSVQEIVIKQAECPSCDSGTIAAPVAEVIPNSYASPSLISQIIISKYLLALPLDRQEKYYKSLGFPLKKQTMSNWIINVTFNYFEGLYNLMQQELLSLNIIHCDETPVQIIKGTPSQNYYQWLYRSGRYDKPIILYECCKSRGSENPIRFLNGYRGYIQCDAWSAYKKIKNVTLVGCLAHVRRKFVEVIKITDSKSILNSISAKLVRFCDSLFKLDKIIHQKEDIEKRRSLKNDVGKKILNSFYNQVESSLNKVSPKSKIGEALTYAINVKKDLYNYLLNPNLEISNNLAERSIKPFVIGRKNWLFSYTPRGAKASSIIYSIIRTAEENNLNSFEYITYLLEQLPNMKNSEIYKVLPWSKELPEQVKKKIEQK